MFPLPALHTTLETTKKKRKDSMYCYEYHTQQRIKWGKKHDDRLKVCVFSCTFPRSSSSISQKNLVYYLNSYMVYIFGCFQPREMFLVIMHIMRLVVRSLRTHYQSSILLVTIFNIRQLWKWWVGKTKKVRTQKPG